MTVFMVEARDGRGRVVETVRVEAANIQRALDEVAADYLGVAELVRGWPEDDPGRVREWSRRTA